MDIKNVYIWGMKGGDDMDKCIDKMERRITSFPKGSAFVVSDFTDMMSYETAKKAIVKLAKSNKIRHVIRGVYDNPSYSSLIHEYTAPKPNEIAKALARNYNWSISVSGEAALNLLGLSTQVPANWCYISSGPYKKYKMGKVSIEFKHRADKSIAGMSEKTAMLIQAIKAIGRDKIDPITIQIISQRLSSEDKKIVITESKKTTIWVYEIIKRICKE